MKWMCIGMKPKSKKVNKLFFFWCLFAGLSLQAQTRMLNKDDLNSLVNAADSVLHFPKHLRENDAMFITGGLAATSFFLPADESVASLMNRNSNSSVHNTANTILNPWGNGLYTLPLFAGLYIAGNVREDKRMSWVGLQGGKATVLAMAISRVPKVLFQRHRPDVNDLNAYQFEGPFKGLTGNYSFPSGHAFIAFAAVSSIAPELKDKPGLVIAMYSIATLVAFNRVYNNDHWLSDAVGGALSGMMFGHFLWRIDTRKLTLPRHAPKAKNWLE